MEEAPPCSSSSLEVLTRGECSQSNGRGKTVRLGVSRETLKKVETQEFRGGEPGVCSIFCPFTPSCMALGKLFNRFVIHFLTCKVKVPLAASSHLSTDGGEE